MVRHMPWGALSGFPRELGHESMFWAQIWGRCGDFCAPVFQYIQYMQILIIYLHIHTYTYIYLYIYTLGRKQNTYCSIILDTIRFLQIHINTNIYLLPKNTYMIPTYTCNTCSHLHGTYLQIVVLTIHFIVGINRYFVGIM